jgi:hypothetical protein
MDRQPGQTGFVSAPPGAQTNSNAGTSRSGGADAAAASDAGASAADSPATGNTRQVQETDVYRVDGTRLYYLNSYRGLLVFDITNLDHPQLIGRAPLFGEPVDMIVHDGVAYALVADWYGATPTGEPFHGSVVRAIDARDANNVRVTSEVQLNGYVRDARVVGDVLYTVSENDYFYDDFPGQPNQPSVMATSVVISDPSNVHIVGSRTWDGYSGIFNVTQNAILMAHANGDYYAATGTTTQIDYIDISDPAGAIVTRGSIAVPGAVNGWGANNGRFNIDYDGSRYVRAIAVQYGTGVSGSQYVLSTVDASDPDHLAIVNSTTLPATGWAPVARFDSGRMYLSPDGYWGGGAGTPVEVFDLTDPAHPNLAGVTNLDGDVWNFIPAGDRLFVLGEQSVSGSPYGSSDVALRYLDVSDPTNPRVVGSSNFGAGWSWTPAADDFKAFTMDATRGLVVLPFSGWDYTNDAYHDGVQLIEFTHDSLTTSGQALTRGWVERGIFVGNRLLSLSDLSLQVVDYSDHAHPAVVSELTLARNVVAAHPMGDTTVELTTDWWGNEQGTTLRVLPTTDPDDNHLTAALAEVDVPGNNGRVFHNGSLAYIVSMVSMNTNNCGAYYYGCGSVAPHVQVVDLTDPHHPVVRGSVTLPFESYGYDDWYWGWWGWWDGDGVVQVGGDALAFRDAGNGYYGYGGGPGSTGNLYVVDIHNPDAPTIASTAVPPVTNVWWGGLHAVGDALYATHYEWVDRDSVDWTVRYFLDRIDVSDRAHPRVASRVNIPGVFIGASDDQREIYTVDYLWNGDNAVNTLDVLDYDGSRATLRGRVDVGGWLGQIFVQNGRAYASAQTYSGGYYGYDSSAITMHMIDLSDPSHPVDRASTPARGWGWLLAVTGDRALVQTDWSAGVSIYRLTDTGAPVFDSFQRTRGWWGYNAERQENTVFLSTGYWGVQTVTLSH